MSKDGIWLSDERLDVLVGLMLMENEMEIWRGLRELKMIREAASGEDRRPSPPVVEGELPELGTFVNLTTLKWWRELVDLNPADLAPRLDSQIKMALLKSPRSEGDK